MKIIGLGHYSRAGKDTFANLLVSYLKPLRAEKVAFAWKLKDICHQLYSWAGVREPEYYETDEGAAARQVVLPTLNLTPVQLWVNMGTPAIRGQVYDATWLDFVLKSDHDCDVLIIPDVRFPNEAEAIRQAGGQLAKVVRTGYGPSTDIDCILSDFNGWDFVFGPTLSALEWQAATLAHAIRSQSQWTQSRVEREQILSAEA